MCKMWLSEAIKRYDIKFRKGEIPIINAGAGSGKSHFIYNELINNLDEYLVDFKGCEEILYVVDTSTLRTAIKDEVDSFSYNDTRIKVITYAKFGSMLDNLGGFRYQIVILDEYQNLFNYCSKYDLSEKDGNKLYLKVINSLVDLCKCRYMIGLSATDGDIKKFTFRKDIKIDIPNKLVFTPSQRANIREYNFEPIYTNSLFNFIKSYDWKKSKHKALLNTRTIKQAEKYKEYFDTIGIESEWICSTNAKDEEGNSKMNDKQLALREALLTGDNKGYYPNNLQVLIVNSAYETGWNIKDARVQIVMIDSTDENYAIQSRNRVRYNIETLIVLCTHYTKSYIEDDDNYYAVEEEFGEYLESNIKVNRDGYWCKVTDFSDSKIKLDVRFIGKKLNKKMKEEIVFLYGKKSLNKTYVHGITWSDMTEQLVKDGYVMEDNKIKKNNGVDDKLVHDINLLINWFDADWDKERASVNDVRDFLDIGVRSWQKVLDSKMLKDYMKKNRITKTTIKGLGKSLYFKKY